MLPSRELRSESLSCGQASHCSFVVNILHRAVEPAKWRTHSSLPAASTATADAVLPSKPSATDRRVCPRPSQYDLQDKGPRLDQEPSFLVQRLLSQPRSSHREAIKNGSIRRAKLLPKSSDGGVKRHRAPSPSCCLAAIMDMLRGRHARRPYRPTKPVLPHGPLVCSLTRQPWTQGGLMELLYVDPRKEPLQRRVPNKVVMRGCSRTFGCIFTAHTKHSLSQLQPSVHGVHILFLLLVNGRPATSHPPRTRHEQRSVPRSAPCN